jgi:hypothetical protein
VGMHLKASMWKTREEKDVTFVDSGH